MNVKKSVCDCGHCFVLKHKVSLDAARKRQRIAKKCKRASETTCMVEMVNRQEKSRLYVTKKRASENSTICKQEQNRVHMAKKRALESQRDF